MSPACATNHRILFLCIRHTTIFHVFLDEKSVAYTQDITVIICSIDNFHVLIQVLEHVFLTSANESPLQEFGWFKVLAESFFSFVLEPHILVFFFIVMLFVFLEIKYITCTCTCIYHKIATKYITLQDSQNSIQKLT